MLPSPVAAQLPLVSHERWNVLAARNDGVHTATTFEQMLMEANVGRTPAPRGLIMPASQIAAPTLAGLNEMARAMMVTSGANRSNVDVLFGGEVAVVDDWAPLRPAATPYVFGWSEGEFRIRASPLITATRRVRAEQLRERVLLLAGRRVCALLTQEIFLRGLEQAIADLDVEVIVVLARHAGTARWAPVLNRLKERAPLIVVSRSAKPSLWDHRERAWDRTRRVEVPGMRIDELRLVDV